MNIKSIISLCLISAICGYYNDLRNMNYIIHVSQVITAAK